MASLLLFSVIIAFIAVILHRLIGLNTPLLFLTVPFFLLGINWGLSNAATITAVNQVVPHHKIGSALGTIMTIWNIVGSILLTISTAVFSSAESMNSFLGAFHKTVNFNILFGAILTFCAFFAFMKGKKREQSL